MTPPDGAYTHARTGMRFPERVAAFERGDIDRYDASGDDVSVGYHERASFITATVHVYPSRVRTASGSPPDAAHFNEVKQDIESVHPTAAIVSDDAPANLGGAIGRTASYEFTEPYGGVTMPLRSDVFLFGRDSWYIKYRFTYPASLADDASASIRAFMDALTWPDTH